jgi:hypothetical protein
MSTMVSAEAHEFSKSAPVSPHWFKLALALALLSGIVVASLQQSSPAPLPAFAAVTEFSAYRAQKYIANIATNPHATGTPANLLTANYIAGELSKLGAHPRVQEAAIVERRPAGFRVVQVRNVIGKIAGSRNSRAVALVAHYDSAWSSPGAADDGSGVATLLETLSALRSGPTLRNDLIFLFTDAEELGLKGAQAFVRFDPEASRVGAVLNFEARGSSGPSIMFETRENDGWIIRAFLAAAPHAVISSLAPSIYRFMANDTDYSVFKQAGISGLNFAFAEDWHSYHAVLDRADRVSLRSLQHHGTYALPVSRYLGNLDLSQQPKQELIYFHLLGPLTILYPASWGLIFSLATAASLLVILFVAVRRRRIMPGWLLLTVLIIPVSGLVAVLVCRLLLQRLFDWSDGRVLFESALFIPAIIALATAVFLMLQAWPARKSNAETVIAGSLLCWALLSLLTSTLLKGASYLFTWPLACAVALFAWIIRGPRQGYVSWRASLLPHLVMLPAILILVPAMDNLFTAFVMAGSAMVALFIVCCLGLFIPALNALLPHPYRTGAALVLVAAALFMTALLRSHQDVGHPRSNFLLYVWNADTRSGSWATANERLDGWNNKLFGASPRTSKSRSVIPGWFGPNPWGPEFKVAPASDARLAAPELSLIEKSADAEAWRLKFRIRSARNAPEMSVRLLAAGSLSSVTVNAESIPLGGANQDTAQTAVTVNRLQLVCIGAVENGWLISVSGRGLAGLQIAFADRSYDLPFGERTGLSERPASLIPDRFSGDSTFVSRSVLF